jgi:Xaa-Pro dipeptidase
MIYVEKSREKMLVDAQTKAADLFAEVENRQLIRSGRSEKDINTDVYLLAEQLYGIKKYWHKRIVRAGKNTLHPYKENPPDMVVRDNDIIFLDFGPVFEDWEADFGRTFVVGNDLSMVKLQSDIYSSFSEGKAYYESHPQITAAELHCYVKSLASKYGWELGGSHCGHLIGKFPHERIEDHEIHSYLHPANDRKLNETDAGGNRLHWILEIHFIDPKCEIGGFTEELLTL